MKSIGWLQVRVFGSPNRVPSLFLSPLIFYFAAAMSRLEREYKEGSELMSLTLLTYLVVGFTFAVYIGIAGRDESVFNQRFLCRRRWRPPGR
jgi:hypothetical protein